MLRLEDCSVWLVPFSYCEAHCVTSWYEMRRTNKVWFDLIWWYICPLPWSCSWPCHICSWSHSSPGIVNCILLNTVLSANGQALPICRAQSYFWEPGLPQPLCYRVLQWFPYLTKSLQCKHTSHMSEKTAQRRPQPSSDSYLWLSA